jgi:hypothetical protein
MDMIGHEDIGVDAPAMTIRGLREPATVLSVVVIAAWIRGDMLPKAVIKQMVPVDVHELADSSTA